MHPKDDTFIKDAKVQDKVMNQPPPRQGAEFVPPPARMRNPMFSDYDYPHQKFDNPRRPEPKTIPGNRKVIDSLDQFR